MKFNKSRSVTGACIVRRALIGASALLVSVSAGAECSASSCNLVQISELYTTKSGDVYVKVNGTMSNLNCTRVSGVFMTLQASATRFKELYASLLAYHLTDRPVSLRIDDGSNGCTIAYVTTGP